MPVIPSDLQRTLTLRSIAIQASMVSCRRCRLGASRGPSLDGLHRQSLKAGPWAVAGEPLHLRIGPSGHMGCPEETSVGSGTGNAPPKKETVIEIKALQKSQVQTQNQATQV